jgi:putative transposase
MALVRLEEFEAEWGKRYPAISQAWRRAWEYVVPFFAFAPGIRYMIYTTNAVEALHRSLRKIVKTRGSFPNDDAALKLLYLAIKNAGMRWRRGIEWAASDSLPSVRRAPSRNSTMMRVTTSRQIQ